MYENCGWVCLPYFSTTFIPLTMCILHYECFMILLFSIKIVCYIAENYPQHPHCRILSFLFFGWRKKKKILLNCCTSYILALTLHLASHLSRLSSLLILILMQKKTFSFYSRLMTVKIRSRMTRGVVVIIICSLELLAVVWVYMTRMLFILFQFNYQ